MQLPTVKEEEGHCGRLYIYKGGWELLIKLKIKGWLMIDSKVSTIIKYIGQLINWIIIFRNLYFMQLPTVLDSGGGLSFTF